MNNSGRFKAVVLIIAILIILTVLFVNYHQKSKENETELGSNESNFISSTYSPSSVSSVSSYAIIGRTIVSESGIIPLGKIYIKIKNIGDNDGTLTINNVVTTLAAADEWVYPSFNSFTTKPASEIQYNASGTHYLIETQEI